MALISQSWSELERTWKEIERISVIFAVQVPKQRQLAQVGGGNVINATSCEYADVKSAYDSASEGSTIQLPACTATWNSTLTISKSVVIKGLGADQTKIVYGGVSPLVSIALSSDTPVRITGIYFDMVDNPTAARYAIYVIGNLRGQFALTKIRIDHNTFNKGGRTVYWKGWAYGLTDNNTFINCNIAVGLTGDDNYSWQRPIVPGTADSVFIEDNQFLHNNDTNYEPNQPIYHQEGSRSVTRHNIFDGSAYTKKTCGNGTQQCSSTFYDSHGNGYQMYSGTSDFRGQPILELYNNTFHSYSTYNFADWRGGSSLIYNNTFINDMGGNPRVLVFLDEEDWGASVARTPLAITWPAEDQINNTFVWNNTYNGSPITDITHRFPEDIPFIQKDRDYFMHAPCDGTGSCTGGKTIYTDRPGGNMTFVSGPNAYYPYTPYTYPHPLRTDCATYPTLCDTGSTPPPSTGSGQVTPLSGTCSSSPNACSSGTLSDQTDTTTTYLWSCQGTGGGTTASCSLPIPPGETPMPVVTPTPTPTPTPEVTPAQLSPGLSSTKIQNITTTGAQISWTTPNLSIGWIEYGRWCQ